MKPALWVVEIWDGKKWCVSNGWILETKKEGMDDLREIRRIHPQNKYRIAKYERVGK